MGVCCSKKSDISSPAKIPPNDSPKEITSVKEETKELKVTEKNPVSSVAVSSLSSKKAFSAEEKDKKGETPVKKSSLFAEENVSKPPVSPAEPRPAPLRTSSCTKEELDAILIQCGRLSRSSSGKTSKDTDCSAQRRYSGSKRSYDFDEERRKEQEDDQMAARPSPRRRAPNRDRSGSRERGNSRERRVSRSPGKRSDGLVSSISVSDKHRQQPAKMVSVPAREKGGLFVNGDAGGGILGAKRVSVGNSVGGLKSSSPRSRSPANTTRPSSENSQIQSLSRSSSKKTDQSPYRRNPLAEIDDKNQNGVSNSVFQKSRVVEEGVRKQKPSEGTNQNISSDQKNRCNVSVTTKQQQQQQKKQEILEQETESKKCIETEIHIPRTLTRTRSSRRSSRDFDNNPGLNQTSYASMLFEDHHTAFSLPACLSKACSILDAVADLNSSCSDRRSYEGDQSGNNNGFARRTFLDDVKEPNLNKYVTVREIRRDLEPQESAGSNSFEGQPLSSMWEMNSVESTGGNTKEVELEDEVGNWQQQKRSGASSSGKNLTVATPLRKKREFDHRKVGGRAFSIPVSAATT